MMQTVIDIKNVMYKYKGAQNNSLSGLSLQVKKGETILLCGASGSGKTSLIRLINGLIPHYYNGTLKGTIHVMGMDVPKTQLYNLAGTVGTVFQNPRSQFFSVDTDGEIVFGPENIGLESTEILKRKNMIIEQMNLKNLMGRNLFELSGGQKQRIACASVAALLPEIILLDEPSSNLDLQSIKELGKIIKKWKEQGKTVIISEHRLWYVKDYVDRVIYMKDGVIVNEWAGERFKKLGEKEIRKLKLRPLWLNEKFSNILCFKSGQKSFKRMEETDSIILKDFYFSYKRKPYIFRKKKFTQSDGEHLNLCVQNLAIPKGKIIGVIGSNGMGKSTFLRCICGLEKDCTGVIKTDGMVYKGRARIPLSYMVMQDVNHQLFTDSVKEEVLLSMKEKDDERCCCILESLGLLKYKDTHPMALSGGQKQRVAIASAVAAGASLLLFDEPTSGLDYSHMEKVGDLLKQLAAMGKTVLVSTHDPELIERCCEYLLCVNNGKVEYV